MKFYGNSVQLNFSCQMNYHCSRREPTCLSSILRMLYYKDIPISSTACIAGILAKDTRNGASQGLPATQARGEVYMPLIQHPEDAA